MPKPLAVLISGFISLIYNASIWAQSVAPIANQAAVDPVRTAIVQPSPVNDGHLGLVGEFDLLQLASGERKNRFGVQVTCIGGDRFQGLLYRGGLPGIGGDSASAIKLRGSVVDEQVDLTGDGVQVKVTPSEAILQFETSDSKSQKPKSVTLQKVIRRSKTLGSEPLPGAIVLFAGKQSDELKNERITNEGFLQVGPETVKSFGAFYMHVEFQTPYLPRSTGQQRGNSGIYVQRRYEVQILDSFALDTVFDGGGSIYRQRKPDVNMCLPPMVWQTYDIFFHPPTWSSDGKKEKMATLSLIHNGVPVHYQNIITAKTGMGQPEGPEPLSILFQNHNDPVVFRNIWMIPLEATNPSVPVSYADGTRISTVRSN